MNDVLEKTDKVNPAYFEKPTSYLQVLQNRKKMVDDVLAVYRKKSGEIKKKADGLSPEGIF